MGKREFLNQQAINPVEQALLANAQQLMQGAQIAAAVRETASKLFAVSIAPYIQGLVMEPAFADQGGIPDPKILRSFAALSVKIAPYLAEAQGMVNIDEAMHWADMQPKQPAPKLAEAG